MKNNILARIILTKLVLLIAPCYRRQRFIDSLNLFIEECMSDFDEDSVKEIMDKLNTLTKYDCDKLFTKSFWYYKIIRFGYIRLEVDQYNPEDCRTYKQFNRAVNTALMAIDYEKSLGY